MSTTDPPSNGPSTPPVPPQLSGITYSGGTPTGTTGNLTEDIPKALKVRPLSEVCSVTEQYACPKQINVTEDFKRLPQMPCVRDALLYGIASGAGVGAIRFMSAGKQSSPEWTIVQLIILERPKKSSELGNGHIFTGIAGRSVRDFVAPGPSRWLMHTRPAARFAGRREPRSSALCDT